MSIYLKWNKLKIKKNQNFMKKKKKKHNRKNDIKWIFLNAG